MTRRTAAKSLLFRLFGMAAASILTVLVLPANPANPAREHAGVEQPRHQPEERFTILWRDPADPSSRDLFYGIGGKQHAPPSGGYRFLKEDRGGGSPKFDVEDSNGVHWKVKIGPETRGEIAATRLVFGAGYYTDEDYFLPQISVENMPSSLKRSKSLVFPDGIITDVRMERQIEDQKKIGNWKWKDRSVQDQRAVNGLRVLMALINNWDLKDINTAIYKRKTSAGDVDYIYAVSDLGTSFGPNNLDRCDTKADLLAYQGSAFILKADNDQVTLATPGSPTRYLLVKPTQYFYRRQLRSIARDIPRSDARWIGEILARLSGRQIRDGFRAAGYSPEEADAFARVVERRIQSLRQL